MTLLFYRNSFIILSIFFDNLIFIHNVEVRISQFLFKFEGAIFGVNEGSITYPKFEEWIPPRWVVFRHVNELEETQRINN